LEEPCRISGKAIVPDSQPIYSEVDGFAQAWGKQYPQKALREHEKIKRPLWFFG
jgi:hypothetical protein